jgi:hypothetical protein
MEFFNENKVSQKNQDQLSEENAQETKKELVFPYNHQERVSHIEKTVAQFNAIFAKLKASQNGEK